MAVEVSRHLSAIEAGAGRRLGQRDDPLLLSVRSGARFSMPGMMETVLDVGLNDDSVPGLAKASGSERFAWDSYRRLVQMFGATVMGVDPALFEEAMALLKEAREAPDDLHLDANDLARLVETYKRLIRDETGEEFPQSPAEQLRRAILAVFRSWNGERARLYRRREHIPDDLGTAVTVQRMVYGNLGAESGSGVAFTRDPATGRPGLYGDYLPDAQGEDVVAGIRNTVPLAELERLDPASYTQLLDHMRTLETHYRDLCDIEFTIERGRLQPRKEPRQVRAELTRQRILAAAARLFAEHGHAAGTTNRIAEQARISIGSLYQYYPNKDAILLELLTRHLDAGVAAVSARPAAEELPESLGEIFRVHVRAAIDNHREDPHLLPFCASCSNRRPGPPSC